MPTQTALPPQTASGVTTQAMPPATTPQAPSTGGASGSWGSPAPAPVAPPTAVPKAPPVVVTAKPAIQNVQKQTAAIAEKSSAVQAQQQQNAALAAKNAADAAQAATGGRTAEQNAAKIKEMQASVVQQSTQAPKPETAPSTAPTETTVKEKPPENVEVVSAPASKQSPEEKARTAIQASDEKAQAAFDEHQLKINQIINGTYPLTDDQKSQLKNIATQFTSLIESQKLSNANYEQSLRVAGISSGRSMYAPEIELGNIKAAMDEGTAKIADIDMKMQTTLLNAREAIKNDNVKMLDSAYQDLMNFESQKRKSITDLYNISTKEIENAKQTYKDAQAEADNYAKLSKPPSSFSTDFFSKMDAQREKVGLPSYSGYSQDIYKLQYDAAVKKTAVEDAKTAAEKVATQTKQAMDLISIFDKTGMKGDIKVGDHTYSYQGTNPADLASGTETDSKTGKVMAWTLDKRTGATKTYDLGITAGDKATTIKDASGMYYSYDPATKTATPIYISDGRAAWDNGPLATGQTGPALPGHEANAGQCGALVNAMYGSGVIGDDLKTGKLDVLAPYKIDFSAKDASNIQAGMTFVQAIGGKNGHIGFVESVGKDPVSGRAFITTFDSNRNSDGKIQHGKQIYLDDSTLKMIADHPAPNLPKFGPDTPPRQLGAPAETDTPENVIDSNSTSILSQTGLNSKVFNYITQGTSALSRMSSAERSKVMADADRWSKSNGIDTSTLQSQYKATNEVLAKNIARMNSTKIMENEVTGTLDNLGKVADNAELSNLKFANVAKIWAGEEVNDPIAQKYAFHLQQLKNEMAGYFAATQGKASPDVVDNKDAERAIKDGLNKGSIEALREAVHSSTEKMGSVMQNSVDSSRKAVWDLFGVGDKYKSTSSQASAATSPPPPIPSTYPDIVKSERAKGVSDSTTLSNILSVYPEYADEVEAARKAKNSDTAILNALIK